MKSSAEHFGLAVEP